MNKSMEDSPNRLVQFGSIVPIDLQMTKSGDRCTVSVLLDVLIEWTWYATNVIAWKGSEVHGIILVV